MPKYGMLEQVRDAFRGIIFDIDEETDAACVLDIFECSDDYWAATMLSDNLGEDPLLHCYEDTPSAINIHGHWCVRPTADVGSRVTRVEKRIMQTTRRIRAQVQEVIDSQEWVELDTQMG